MSLEIEQAEHDGVAIVRLNGRLILGDEVESLRKVMESVLDSGQTRIALDLSEVDYIDSSGLGCLVMQHTRTEKAGGVMVLFGLKKRPMDLMILTKLATVFKMTETELDAVTACFPQRSAKRFDILEFVASQKKADSAA